jgi:XTP/dITP diphosphohydrolase
VAGPDDVVRNWERIKQSEKGRESIFEGIPAHLPALLYALKVQKKAAALAEQGVEVPPLPPPGAHDVGDRLFALVDEARRRGVDPETALRWAADRYREAVQANEQAGERGS